MSLPVRAFWMLNSNVSRLQAEKDLRQVTIQMARHGGDGANEIRQHLEIELGSMGRTEEDNDPMKAVRDDAGFDELRSLAFM